MQGCPSADYSCRDATPYDVVQATSWTTIRAAFLVRLNRCGIDCLDDDLGGEKEKQQARCEAEHIEGVSWSRHSCLYTMTHQVFYCGYQ